MAPIMLQHPDNEDRIVELVRRAIARNDVSRIVFVVAWVQTKAMNALREPIRHAAIDGKNIILIFGDNPRARFHDKPALETLLDLQTKYPNITIYRHRAGVLFHPKLYYVAGNKDAKVNIIIGSANLTGAGLGINQNRNLNNVEMVVHGGVAADKEDVRDVEDVIKFLIDNEKSTVLDKDWVGKYKQMKPYDKSKILSRWQKILRWAKRKFRNATKRIRKLKPGKPGSRTGGESSSSDRKRVTSVSDSLIDSDDALIINEMTHQELVNQIEIQVSDVSSPNYVITRMRERSQGDGNNSSKYLGIVPLTVCFLLDMDDTERLSLLARIRRSTTFSCPDEDSWNSQRNAMPASINTSFRDFVRQTGIQQDSIYRIRGGEITVENIRALFGPTWGGTAGSNTATEVRWALYIIAHRIWDPNTEPVQEEE